MRLPAVGLAQLSVAAGADTSTVLAHCIVVRAADSPSLSTAPAARLLRPSRKHALPDEKLATVESDAHPMHSYAYGELPPTVHVAQPSAAHVSLSLQLSSLHRRFAVSVG